MVTRVRRAPLGARHSRGRERRWHRWAQDPRSGPPAWRHRDGLVIQGPATPETEVGRPRLGLRTHEPLFVADIRWDRQHAGVPATDHFEVDHRAADPDVGEQPPIAIALLAVQLKPDM